MASKYAIVPGGWTPTNKATYVKVLVRTEQSPRGTNGREIARFEDRCDFDMTIENRAILFIRALELADDGAPIGEGLDD